MSVKPKVVNGFSRTFVCKMAAGLSTNLYSIGGDPLTQLIIIFVEKFNFFQNVWISWHSQKMNGKIIWWRPTDPIIIQIN